VTHADLCRLAAQWLKRPGSRQGPGCVVAFNQTAPMGSTEVTDAVGWTGLISVASASSVLVEAKISRADFLADRNKPFRQNPDQGIGDFRYYLAPRGLIAECDLPPKWGLIEHTGRGLAVVRGHVLERHELRPNGRYKRDLDRWRFTKNAPAEIAFLARMLQRVNDAEEAHERIANAERRASALERRLADATQKLRKLEGEALARTLASFAEQDPPHD
jgi:hypothetical protein